MKWHTIRDAQVTDKWETKGVCSVGRSYRRVVPVTTKINLAGTAPRTDQPLTPIENRGVRAISGSHLCGVGLDLTAAGFAPNDRPDLGRGGST